MIGAVSSASSIGSIFTSAPVLLWSNSEEEEEKKRKRTPPTLSDCWWKFTVVLFILAIIVMVWLISKFGPRWFPAETNPEIINRRLPGICAVIIPVLGLGFYLLRKMVFEPYVQARICCWMHPPEYHSDHIAS